MLDSIVWKHKLHNQIALFERTSTPAASYAEIRVKDSQERVYQMLEAAHWYCSERFRCVGGIDIAGVASWSATDTWRTWTREQLEVWKSNYSWLGGTPLLCARSSRLVLHQQILMPAWIFIVLCSRRPAALSYRPYAAVVGGDFASNKGWWFCFLLVYRFMLPWFFVWPADVICPANFTCIMTARFWNT